MDENLSQDLGVLIQRRYEELSELKQKGIEPFAYSFDVDSNSENIKDNFKEDEKRIVKIAGRIMAIRRMGKASFAHVQDHNGRIQIYLKKDELGENYDVFNYWILVTLSVLKDMFSKQKPVKYRFTQPRLLCFLNH